MKINFKKTYKFAVKSALYISVFSTAFVVLLLMSLSILLKACYYSKLFSFSGFMHFRLFVLQYRVERFIYRRKKIYDDALLESSSFINQPITTDMETLTREVKKFN
jgi:two-component system phosphate regulon sensor histidine kinase PhoR